GVYVGEELCVGGSCVLAHLQALDLGAVLIPLLVSRLGSGGVELDVIVGVVTEVAVEAFGDVAARRLLAGGAFDTGHVHHLVPVDGMGESQPAVLAGVAADAARRLAGRDSSS